MFQKLYEFLKEKYYIVKNYLKDKYDNMLILDKYLLKQVIAMFLMGVFVFSTIIFASDTFITLINQIYLWD